MARYTGDFETTTSETDCRVWAWGVCNIDDVSEFEYDNNILSFLQWAYKKNNPIVYFHNLKFDVSFILSELFRLGYTHSKYKKAKTFNTIISSTGVVYSLEIVFKYVNKKMKKVTIYDSLKKLPFKVSEIAKAFDLPVSKQELDYSKPRPIGYQLEDYEVDYLRCDVEIVARALKIQFDEGMEKMTIGSDALFDYKNRIGVSEFKHTFPIFDLEKDEDLRKTYRGGFTYCNPEIQGVDVGEGLVYDVNSLYPYCMRYSLLPVGVGVKFEGKYIENEEYPLYTQKIITKFKVKDKHIPTIQIKKSSRFKDTDYVTDSGIDEVVLYLTSVDLKLFIDHYNPDYIEYEGGWMFKGVYGLFDDYIDYWNGLKMASNDNAAIRTLCKLHLNNLYGKFGTNPDVTQKIPYINDEGIVKYKTGDPDVRHPVYVVMASFITAYARELTIRAAQREYDRFLYADTDSLHLKGLEEPDIEIDALELGKFKLEYKFRKAKYLKQKTYIEDAWNEKKKQYELKVVVAGMQEESKKLVTFENFKKGTHYPGTLSPKRVPGGIVLIDEGHTIK